MLPSHIYRSPLMYPIPLPMLGFAPFIYNSLDGRSHFCHVKKTTWNVGSSEHRTCFPLSCQISLGPEDSSAFLHKIVSFLQDTISKSISWCSGVVQSTNRAHVVRHSSMTVSNAVLPKGSKVTPVQQHFHIRRDSSWLPWISQVTADGDRPKFFASLCWETLF